jgi:hypothetical protein
MKDLWTSLVNIGIIDRRNSRESKHIAFLNTIVLLVLLLIIQNSILSAFYHPSTLSLSLIFAGHFLFIALIRNDNTDNDTRWTAVESLGRIVRRRFHKQAQPVQAALEWLAKHENRNA